MIAVIFEVEPLEARAERYFELAESLRPLLEASDGFVSVERFESKTRPGRYLSLSFWRDEAAARKWRCQVDHQAAQQQGRRSVFASYRIRVAEVVRDYGMADRAEAPDDTSAAPL